MSELNNLYETLQSEIEQYHKTGDGFHFEMEAIPGVVVTLDWPDEWDDFLLIQVDPRTVEEYPVNKVRDVDVLDHLGNWWSEFSDRIACIMDGVFRDSINQSPTGHFEFVEEWSNENNHVWSTRVLTKHNEAEKKVVL